MSRYLAKPEVKHTVYIWEIAPSYNGIYSSPQPFIIWPEQGLGGDKASDLFANTARRIGNEIYLKSVSVNLSLFANGANTHWLVRFCVFQWLDESSDVVYPNYDDIFSAQEDETEWPFLDFYNPDTSQKYKILYNKTFRVCANGDTASQIHRFSLKPLVRNIKFRSNTDFGNNANLEKGQLYVICDSNGGNLSTNLPKVIYEVLMSYTDA